MKQDRTHLLCRGVWLLLAALPALTWGAEPAASEAAASSAAMLRAERMANSPLRAIQEAARIQRRGSAEPPSPQRVTPSLQPTPTPAVQSQTKPAATPKPSPAEAVLTVSGLLANPAPAPAPPLATQATSREEPAPRPTPSLAALAPAITGPVQPQLLSKMEPEIPPRVLAEIGELSTVWFDLSLRADGSVAEATLVPPAPSVLQRVLGPVLLQWRYAPLPVPQMHRIQLVFN